MDSNSHIEITPAQGRSLLEWAGKRPLKTVASHPAQLIETFSSPSLQEGAKWENACQVYHGDNKDVLATLLANGLRGRVKLVYIDPPFDTGSDFTRNIMLRGEGTLQSAVRKRVHSLGKQMQYSDTLDTDAYLQYMYERLLLLRDCLAEDGSIWLHCDYRRMHYLRLLLEEVFGPENYLNTISWRSQTARGAKVNARYFPFSTQYIEIFARNRVAPPTWNVVRKQIVMREAEAAAAFMRDERGFFRTSDPGSYSFESLKALHAEGRLYAPYGGHIVVDEESRRIYASHGGNIGVKYYLKKLGGNRYAVERAIDNLWEDVPGLGTTPGEDLGYPTQKTEALLRRIIAVSTNPGDVVMDCFAGSGTTAAVAQKMGRRWIVCDSSMGAVQTTIKRLQLVMTRAAAHPRTRVVDRNQPGTPHNTQDRDVKSPADAPGCATHFEVYRVGTGVVSCPDAPAQARVRVERYTHDDAQPVIRVMIEDYSSPSIAARWADGEAQSRAPVAGWRNLVERVAIDPCFDGKVLRVALSDVPPKRRDLIVGSYELPAPLGTTLVAVKITDVLGEEVLVTQRV
ncbi:MAG: site-specific DNA-methyltransferase [Chloroflexi bacterium]|nr:site-specific DNA-methyltransferase [Chloroflexota bacterium]